MNKKRKQKVVGILTALFLLTAPSLFLSCTKNEVYYEDCAGVINCRFFLSDGRVFDCSVDQVQGKIQNDKDSLLFGTSSTILSNVKLQFNTTMGAKVYSNSNEILSGESTINLNNPVKIKAVYNNAEREYNVSAFIEKLDHSETSGAKVNTDMRVTGLPAMNSTSAAFFNGKLYLLGSYYPGGTSATATAYYELYESTNGVVWTKVNTTPSVLGGFGAVLLVYNNKLYAIGGSRLYGKDITGTTPESSIKWRIMSSSDGINWDDCTVNQVNAPSGRCFPQVCVHNGKIVLRRGKSLSFGMWQNVSHSDTYQTTDGTNWTKVSATPTSGTNRSDDAMFSFNGKLWITGGYASYISTTNVKEDVWSSSDNGATWVQETSASGDKLGRLGHSVVSYNGKLYMIGGEYFDGSSRVGYSKVLESVNGINWTPLSESTQLPPAFKTRIYSSVFMGASNTFWIIGGYTASSGNYTIGGITMTSLYDVWTKKIK